MPADWGSFISKVSSKLESRSIKDSDDMADFLTKEYISATVGKAQSPFGNLHKKGNDSVMKNKFSQAFKMLEKERTPSFADKEKDPQYADLKEPLPEIDASDAANQVELDFRDWVEANKSTIPPFTYSQFFSQYPNFPKDRNQAVIEIARKILNQFDGTGSYLQWMYSLRSGSYSNWGNLIMDQVIDLLNLEVKRQLQPGDVVRGYAKYVSREAVSNYNELESFEKSFNDIKGDVNVDNTDQYSTTYKNRDGNNIFGGNSNDSQDLINGKIVSISKVNGVDIIKASYFSKKYSRTFIRELIPGTINRRISLKEISDNLPSVNITDRLFQEQNLSNPNKIPDYLTENFITHFTYSKYDSGYLKSLLRSQSYSDSAIESIESEFDSNYQYADDIVGLFSRDKNNSIFGSNYSNILNNIFGSSSSNTFDLQWIKLQRDSKKSYEYTNEETRYRDLKIRWINEIAEAARKNEDPDNPEDPYSVMAKGVIDYWKSAATQPLQPTPPVPPAVIVPPQGGSYVPIYYGSSTSLANNLRRAFNSGKSYKGPGQEIIAAKVVSAALAFSFAMHLLELKFIYRGGIPGPNGPIPMIGFVPIVF